MWPGSLFRRADTNDEKLRIGLGQYCIKRAERIGGAIG